MKIALTGVTGKLGGQAADILKGKNLDLRYLARRPGSLLYRGVYQGKGLYLYLSSGQFLHGFFC